VRRIAQRRRLGVDRMRLLADVGGLEDAEPSAYAAMIPYSMPLWTIFTKCPAPLGPQCR
jgi:hypothetical protein